MYRLMGHHIDTFFLSLKTIKILIIPEKINYL